MEDLRKENKYKQMFNFFGKWVTLNETGMTVGNFLKERKIQNVAIYGLGALGRHLLYELQEEGINVVYGIDQRSDRLNINIPFMDWSNKESLPDIDLLIVTPITDYDEIEREICEVREYPIISLEDIIRDMERLKSYK